MHKSFLKSLEQIPHLTPTLPRLTSRLEHSRREHLSGESPQFAFAGPDDRILPKIRPDEPVSHNHSLVFPEDEARGTWGSQY